MSKKIRIRTSLIWAILFIISLHPGVAQNTYELRFNEILVLNDSANIDDFGQHSPWIEIFNTSYNTVDIGGCYLTDDMKNPTKYWIPNEDVMTQIPPRGYILFWADGMPSRGIRHLNFNLRNADTLALFDTNGRTLLDKMAVPKQQKSNVSYGYEESLDENGKTVSTWVPQEKITPATHNDHKRRASSGEQFVKHDPKGFGMTVIAMTAVFLSLAVLYLIFKTTGNFFQRTARKAKKAKQTLDASAKEELDLSGEVTAAIAMALHLYQSEMHDHENTILTIKKVARPYSPWSSKIHTLRKYPQ